MLCFNLLVFTKITGHCRKALLEQVDALNKIIIYIQQLKIYFKGQFPLWNSKLSKWMTGDSSDVFTGVFIFYNQIKGERWMLSNSAQSLVSSPDRSVKAVSPENPVLTSCYHEAARTSSLIQSKLSFLAAIILLTFTEVLHICTETIEQTRPPLGVVILATKISAMAVSERAVDLFPNFILPLANRLGKWMFFLSIHKCKQHCNIGFLLLHYLFFSKWTERYTMNFN